MAPDLHVYSWADLEKDFNGGSVLLGNGASCAIWSRFRYGSLFDTAVSQGRLEPGDKALFERMGTHDFERVLASLRTTTTVLDALGRDSTAIQDRYRQIQHALGEAVRDVHVPWQMVPTTTLEHICVELGKYDFVFSTNYDLLTYWSVIRRPLEFCDYFWSSACSFVLGNTDVWGKKTKVLYLHGGLHLRRTPEGRTYKRIAQDGSNLLVVDDAEDTPLFIAEGTADEKRSAVYRSDYLSFALSELGRFEHPLVVFGHTLGRQDEHIVEAINRHAPRRIAVSVREASATDDTKKYEILGRVPYASVRFFLAETHPLGAPNLSLG